MKPNHMKIHMFSSVTICIFLGFISCLDVCMADDSLSNSQSVTVNEPLISLQKKFQLGFFNPGNSSRFYLAIWFKNIPTKTTVWIANRDNPLIDSPGSLRIGNDGNLILVDKTERTFWSTNLTGLSSNTTFVKLFDSGNLVLSSDNRGGRVLWQSFDHPSDIIIAGMRFGWDAKTGTNRFLTSWKSSDDPSPGDYIFRFDIRRLPQSVIPQAVVWKGYSKQFRTAPWNGFDLGGVVASIEAPFTPKFSVNSEEVIFEFRVDDNSSAITVGLSYLGAIQFRLWDNSMNDWRVMLEYPPDNCGKYNFCGANSICTITNFPICSCLVGYIPKYLQQWNVGIWTGGCVRKYRLDCPQGEGFREIIDAKKPDLLQFMVNTSMTLEECRNECLRNCSCTAYANSNATGPGHGCLLWYGDIIDVRKITDSANAKLYVRVTALDLEPEEKKNKKKIVVVIVLTIIASIFLLLTVGFAIWKRKSNKGKRNGMQLKDNENLDLPCFNIVAIAKATQNFSDLNKIGEGGFGPVYKGVLSHGQQVAVKRLSQDSSQGLNELKNEVKLIAKLQHRNLVKLVGCCIQEEERILIYEYMPNGSLDSYIFGESNYGKRHLLVWRRRFSIIVGIARGLLYLHRDSRLRIIHRDLKASNVLLDSEMNPKISDFGMARAFKEDQSTTRTALVVGTYGYMAPEYAIRGIFSMKSDVFSFGVLALEIISGQKNNRFHHPDHDFNLLGHAWKLWVEGRASKLIDPLMEDSYPSSEVLRCIQIGLLCVQQRPDDRPTMSSVLLMLDSESAMLPSPKYPGFSTEKGLYDDSDCLLGGRSGSTNEVTTSIIEGR